MNIETFRKLIRNADEIIVKHSLCDENLEKFIKEHCYYLVDEKSDHRVDLICGIENNDTYSSIDCELVDLIVWLNENEYYTDWCCQGGVGKQGYIAFTNGLNGKELSLEKRLDISLVYANLRAYYPQLELTNHATTICLRWSFDTEEENSQFIQRLTKAFIEEASYAIQIDGKEINKEQFKNLVQENVQSTIIKLMF